MTKSILLEKVPLLEVPLETYQLFLEHCLVGKVEGVSCCQYILGAVPCTIDDIVTLGSGDLGSHFLGYLDITPSTLERAKKRESLR